MGQAIGVHEVVASASYEPEVLSGNTSSESGSPFYFSKVHNSVLVRGHGDAYLILPNDTLTGDGGGYFKLSTDGKTLTVQVGMSIYSPVYFTAIGF